MVVLGLLPALSPVISPQRGVSRRLGFITAGKVADSNTALGETPPEASSSNGASLDADMKRGRSTWREASNPCSTVPGPGDPGQFADPPSPHLSLQLEVGHRGSTPHILGVIVSLGANVQSQVTQCLIYSPAQSCTRAPTRL